VARIKRGRAAVRGRSAVVGGRLLSREAVRRLRGAQDGEDEAGGGTTWADITEVLGGGCPKGNDGGGASGGGGQQLMAWGGRTRWHGARGVVEVV
jgi:hypothetical protein